MYLAPGKVSAALIIGDTPRKMTIALLECIFPKESLAKGKCKGIRTAHNAKEESKALPGTVLSAIKEFVLNKFKQDNTQPCLTDKEFTEIINAKCGTVRRSLKKNAASTHMSFS